MTKIRSLIENILSLLLLAPAAMVQLIEPNRRTWALTAALFVLLPIGALADDNLKTDAISPENLVVGGSNIINYQIQAVGSCDVSSGSSATVTINAPSGISTTTLSAFTSCGINKPVTFTATSAAVGLKTITATVNKAGIVNTTATFTLNVSAAGDTTKPVITILGNNPASIIVNSIYTDAGATASDNVDGNITSKIVTDLTNVNRLVIGTYKVTYNVKDSAGNAATQAERTVNVMAAPSNGKGTVVIAFDDGWKDAITNAFPVLDANGQQGVIFAIPEVIDGGYTDYMSLTDLTGLYGAGWDISSHSSTHGSKYATDSTQQLFYLTRANNTELKTELGDSKDWLDNKGFINSSMFFAYPFGTYDNVYCMSVYNNLTTCGSNDLPTEIKNAGYYVGARSIDAYSWRHGGSHPKYRKGDVDALKMATMAIDNTANSNPTAVKAEIDKTISENGLLILTFHHIVTGTPASAEEYSKADLKTISDYLVSKGSNVTVQTFSQYFSVPNPIPTYMPGTPIAGIPVITNNSIKFQWVDGIGDKTDVFDINVTKNGVMTTTYNVVNRYMNVTGLTAGTSVTIEVSAINRSWGQTNRNVGSLTMTNTTSIPQVPLIFYIPPTPNNTTSVGSKILSWTAGNVGNKTDSFIVNINDSIWANGTTSYDTTSLSPGVYNVRVYAVNTSNGTTTSVNSLNLTSTVEAAPADTTAPVITIIAPTAMTYTEGSTVLANFTCSDANLKSCNGTVDNGAQMNVTGAGTKTFTVNAEDMAGNKNSSNITYTIVAAPVATPAPSNSGSGGSSSGSSSGGGGGGSAEPYANILKYEIQEHEVFTTPVSFKYNTPELGVYEVMVTANQTNLASLRIEVLRDTSGLVGMPAPAIVYKNLNIWIDYKRIKNAPMRFKVENSWISSNGLSSADIKMYRWDTNGKKWIELSTGVINKDDKYTYFESQADSLSASFAISGIKEEKVPAMPGSSTNLAQVEVKQTENKPVSTKTPGAPGFEIMLSIVSILSMVYLLKRIKR